MVIQATRSSSRLLGKGSRVLVWPREWNPGIPALQSSALPTELNKSSAAVEKKQDRKDGGCLEYATELLGDSWQALTFDLVL